MKPASKRTLKAPPWLDLLRTRQLAVEQAVTEARQMRFDGKLVEAQARLQQALAIDPVNERLVAQIAEIKTESAQLAALAEAQDLAARGLPDAALRRIGEALQDNPRHQGLLGLQRKLETAQRRQLLGATRAMLTEVRPISLDFRDAGLRTVLDMVSRTSGINCVFDRDLHSDVRVSVYMRQAKVQDALDLIASTNGLAMKVVDAKTVLIYPNTPDKQREYQEQVVRVFYLSNADAKGAASFLRAMLKLHDPFVDARTNMIALRVAQDEIPLRAVPANGNPRFGGDVKRRRLGSREARTKCWSSDVIFSEQGSNSFRFASDSGNPPPYFGSPAIPSPVPRIPRERQTQR